MRAAEFIRALADIIDHLDGKDSAEEMPARDPKAKSLNPIMVPPLQQDLEVKKSIAGKTSPVIKLLTQDEQEAHPQNPIFRTR